MNKREKRDLYFYLPYYWKYDYLESGSEEKTVQKKRPVSLKALVSPPFQLETQIRGFMEFPTSCFPSGQVAKFN